MKNGKNFFSKEVYPKDIKNDSNKVKYVNDNIYPKEKVIHCGRTTNKHVYLR